MASRRNSISDRVSKLERTGSSVLSGETAKHLQIYGLLKDAIVRGELEDGSRLRPEREMIVEFGVSRNTLRQALGALEREGFLYREAGVGTFVSLSPLLGPVPDTSKGREIGVFLPRFDADFQAHFLQGIDEILAAEGMSMSVSLYSTVGDDEAKRMRDLLSTGLAGIIVFPSYRSSGNLLYPRIEERLPLVFVDNPVQGTAADVVLMDDHGSAYAGTRELLARGRRRIAYLGGYYSAWTSRERYSGFRRALSEAGVPFDPSLVLEGPFTHDFGFRAMNRLLDSVQGIDGLFIANHPITEGAVRAILLRDKSLLDRIGICSFGDEGFGSHYLLPIIVARQPVAEMGRCAARRMLELVAARRKGLPRPPFRTITVREGLRLPEEKEQSGALVTSCCADDRNGSRGGPRSKDRKMEKADGSA